MKRLLNEVRKGDDTDVENELFLDNDNNPLLRNKNYIINKNTSESNNIISYSIINKRTTTINKRTKLTSDNLNGDNSLYKAYKKEVEEKIKPLVNSIDAEVKKGNEELANFNISEVF